MKNLYRNNILNVKFFFFISSELVNFSTTAKASCVPLSSLIDFELSINNGKGVFEISIFFESVLD